MKLSNYKFIAVPLTVIILSLVTLAAIVPKTFREVSEGLRGLQKTEGETKDMKTKYLLVTSLDEEKLKSQSALAKAALPEDKNVPLVLQAVRDTAAESGFIIKNLKFAPGELEKEEEMTKLEKKKIEELPITIKIVGPFLKLDRFFSLLENTLPLFQGEDVEIINAEKSGGNSNIEIKMVTFFSPPAASYNVRVLKLEDLVISEEENSFLEKLGVFKKTEVIIPVFSETQTERQNPFTL